MMSFFGRLFGKDEQPQPICVPTYSPYMGCFGKDSQGVVFALFPLFSNPDGKEQCGFVALDLHDFCAPVFMPIRFDEDICFYSLGHSANYFASRHKLFSGEVEVREGICALREEPLLLESGNEIVALSPQMYLDKTTSFVAVITKLNKIYLVGLGYCHEITLRRISEIQSVCVSFPSSMYSELYVSTVVNTEYGNDIRLFRTKISRDFSEVSDLSSVVLHRSRQPIHQLVDTGAVLFSVSRQSGAVFCWPHGASSWTDLNVRGARMLVSQPFWGNLDFAIGSALFVVEDHRVCQFLCRARALGGKPHEIQEHHILVDREIVHSTFEGETIVDFFPIPVENMMTRNSCCRGVFVTSKFERGEPVGYPTLRFCDELWDVAHHTVSWGTLDPALLLQLDERFAFLQKFLVSQDNVTVIPTGHQTTVFMPTSYT